MNQEEKNETPLANGDGTRKKKLDKQHKMNGKQKQQARSIAHRVTKTKRSDHLCEMFEVKESVGRRKLKRKAEENQEQAIIEQ
jgi:hypothetical protein